MSAGRGGMDPAPAPVPDGPARRQFHLAAWDRYRHLLEEQLACLESHEPDLERFRALARQRDRLAEVIDALRLTVADSPEAAEQLARIGRRAAECQARDRAVLDRLRALREDTERVIRASEDRRPGRRGYVVGSRLARRADGALIDVRS